MKERVDVGIVDTPDLRADADMHKIGGAYYVRWGRNDCPPQADLIYEDVVGGSFYTQEGSGSNYLCLPEYPIYDEPVAG
ncbi:hypothetical protein HOLleu_06280 [Holothuria leucospilota]|uniref:Uncharacterized protein n=1 Tax=Holothuria leucospilota TaxID=206669 RepID=A0A9Q1HF19_HOLLE|nr:hypothetical protein HOLleu_06280 [Holothuria leucospilota]